MKVIIAGTRYKDPINKIAFDDHSAIVEAVRRSGFEITEVVSGNAIGVDTLGEIWAVAHNKLIKYMPVTPAEWSRLGKRAGPMRNQRMAQYADAAIIIWDGVSPGSKNMIAEMVKLKKPYYVYLTFSNLEELLYE